MKNKLVLISVIFILHITSNYSQTKVASIFQNNMVLQEGIEIPIWGTGKSGDSVEVTFKEQSVKIEINESGNWILKLKPEEYGGPFSLKIISKDTTILSNVLVGEVWVCSGQSNMTMKLRSVNNYEQEIKNANYPNIRLCTIPLTLASKPNSQVKVSGWDECSPESVENFSAVSYFFGREIYNELKVPIGLIHVSKGGTPIESWMSKELLESNEKYKSKIDFVESSSDEIFSKINSDYKKEYKNWLANLLNIEQGLSSEINWYNNNLNYSSWKTMQIPNAWENGGIGDFDGVVWFKKEVELSEEFLESKITLTLGTVQDANITFVNGEKIGTQLSRDKISTYKIPPKVLHKGKNIITVLVLDNYGVGGLWDYYNPIAISNSINDTISLAGNWFYKTSINLDTLSYKPPERPLIERYPTILFNGMINPIIPFGMKGIIWYQGESNAKDAYNYRFLFENMITDWRRKWDEGDFPFFFVQLANYTKPRIKPAEDRWAELRESQAYVLKINNTGMATAIDIGNNIDVHPKNKQEVGKRLALNALAKTYKKNKEFAGPTYESFTINNDTVYISFSHCTNGLLSKDEKDLREFTISGEDHKFYIAQAKIIGNKILVWSEDVESPVAVRYAWQANPDVNLINEAGLPAFPFRTDSWKLSTEE
ncbi:MAG: 9-O-acetylesterase [Bacteroidetes bacterium]|nr:9-O-acetylesterase [Bacteroidota bacterium]MBU1117043.1 9-O-acetylesterase [Bacteroidota bacterium]MBU1797638.1 9-O-acetylesterase [Bacteroidota bacterium]